MVVNTHEREISATSEEVGALIDSLGSQNDRLWPRAAWPALRLDRPLGVGAAGGHGPVRYHVTSYEPARRVEFQFTEPRGFHGTHCFSVVERVGRDPVLRHELTMKVRGIALLSWPLFFRPLHDALIEEGLDLAQSQWGNPIRRHRRSLWTRILRAPFAGRMGANSQK